MVNAYESVRCSTTSYSENYQLCSSARVHINVEEEADSVPELLQSKEDIAQGVMMRKQLHLSRTIEQDVIVCTDCASVFVSLSSILLSADNLSALSNHSQAIQNYVRAPPRRTALHHSVQALPLP